MADQEHQPDCGSSVSAAVHVPVRPPRSQRAANCRQCPAVHCPLVRAPALGQPRRVTDAAQQPRSFVRILVAARCGKCPKRFRKHARAAGKAWWWLRNNLCEDGEQACVQQLAKGLSDGLWLACAPCTCPCTDGCARAAAMEHCNRGCAELHNRQGPCSIAHGNNGCRAGGELHEQSAHSPHCFRLEIVFTRACDRFWGHEGATFEHAHTAAVAQAM